MIEDGIEVHWFHSMLSLKIMSLGSIVMVVAAGIMVTWSVAWTVGIDVAHLPSKYIYLVSGAALLWAMLSHYHLKKFVAARHKIHAQQADKFFEDAHRRFNND